MRRALEQNGLSPPIIETNNERSFFLVRLPVHPHFVSPDRVEVQVGRDQVQVEVADSEGAIQLTAIEIRILGLCTASPRAGRELSRALGYQELTGNVRASLRKLRELELLSYTIPDKPNSRLQRYLTTPKGAQYLATHGQS